MRLTSNINRAKSGERGFSYIMTAVCASVLLGMLGLAMDLGRMYVVRTELQAFTDNAAVAAVYQLDQTLAGIERARVITQTGPGLTPNRYDFNTQTIPADRVNTAFSTISTGGWEASPASGAGRNFIRVFTFADVPVYMIRVLQALTGGSINTEMRVSAVSFAGLAQVPVGPNADPFSPDAVTNMDPAAAAADPTFNFGFRTDADVLGDPLLYTLKWVPQGLRCNFLPPNPDTNGPPTTMCPVAADEAAARTMAPSRGYCSGDYFNRYQPNDGTYAYSNAEADRGYIDMGQGTGTRSLGEAIVNNDYDAPDPVDISVGAEIQVVGGNRGNPVQGFMDTRFAQDTDRTSTTYAAYLAAGTGNGRRMLTVPINNWSTNRIMGYATFFMPIRPCGTTNSDPCCAEYVGRSAVIGGIYMPPGGNAGTLYAVKLFSGEVESVNVN